MKKRILAVFLACMTLLGCLGGCGSTDVGPGEGSEDLSAAEENTSAPEVKDLCLVSDGAAEYKVIRPEANNDSPEVNAAVRLRNTIKEKTGTSLEISDDWIRRDTEPPATAKEILIGGTNRKESANAISLIREKDFIIRCENERVVVTGGCPEATERAVDYFLEHYVDADGKKVVLADNTSVIVRYDYLYGSIAVNGTALTAYSVVYPEGCDKITYYCAMNLADALKNYAGVTLPLVSDKEAETEYEILVGLTNRRESAEAAKTAAADGEYILCLSGKKLVMLGNSYMCGAAAGVFMTQYLASTGVNCEVNVTNLPTAPKAEKFTFSEPRSAILMIGDGMGRNQVQSTLDMGKLDVFVGDLLPGQVYCTTYSYSVKTGSKSYTDSAAAGTALATGYKTINGYIGIDNNKKSRQNLRELAASKGAMTSILTTDVITGATPAAFLAHQNSRNDTEEIQAQIDKEIKSGSVQYCKGSVGDKLRDCTRESLQLISGNRSAFFTMIEEAYTDKGGHNNKMDTVNSAVVRLNDSVAYAIGFVMVHPDTILLVTADHETGGIQKNADGTYSFTTDNHTNTDVPVYGIGAGVPEFLAQKVDNTDISKFIAKIYTAESFGGNNK